MAQFHLAILNTASSPRRLRGWRSAANCNRRKRKHKAGKIRQRNNVGECRDVWAQSGQNVV